MDAQNYSKEDMRQMLSDGYIVIHESLWDRLPCGAHIRYMRKGSTAPPTRFNPGGFVAGQFLADDGNKMLAIESRFGGRKGDPGYVSYNIAYDDIEVIWKRYDKNAFIELHLAYTSLAQKKKQIERLQRDSDALTSRVKKLEELMEKMIGN
jgi:hypothetical protein